MKPHSFKNVKLEELAHLSEPINTLFRLKQLADIRPCAPCRTSGDNLYRRIISFSP